jgi:hypothetical protein
MLPLLLRPSMSPALYQTSFMGTLINAIYVAGHERARNRYVQHTVSTQRVLIIF